MTTESISDASIVETMVKIAEKKAIRHLVDAEQDITTHFYAAAYGRLKGQLSGLLSVVNLTDAQKEEVIKLMEFYDAD